MKKFKEFILEKVDRNKLITGNIYQDNACNSFDSGVNSTVLFIGDIGTKFPMLFLIFEEGSLKEFEFIEWISDIGSSLSDMNMTLQEYIYSNPKIIYKLISACKKKHFASGGNKKSKILIGKLLVKLETMLFEDEKLKQLIDAVDLGLL